MVISTPMMMSAPTALAMSVGKLFFVPPSEKSIESTRTGMKYPGIDIVERIASMSGPSGL